MILSSKALHAIKLNTAHWHHGLLVCVDLCRMYERSSHLSLLDLCLHDLFTCDMLP